MSQYQSKQFQESVLANLEPLESIYRMIKLEQDPTVDYNLMNDKDGKEINLQKAPLFSFDTDYLTLYLKYIPKHIKRLDLTSSLQKNLNGFVHLSMSEPMRNHDFERLAWATFSNENDCQQAEHQISQIRIDDCNLSAVRSLPNRKRTPVRITPPLPQSLVEVDLELCKYLITDVLDPERDIESFIVQTIEKYAKPEAVTKTLDEDMPANDQNPAGQNDHQILDKTELTKSQSMPLPGSNDEIRCLSKEQQLDILLIYLRRVHAYCLYCGEEYEDERMLSTRCGP